MKKTRTRDTPQETKIILRFYLLEVEMYIRLEKRLLKFLLLREKVIT